MPTILTILYTERVLAGTPPLHAGPQSRVDTRPVNSVNTVTGKYLVTHRKYLVLHCYFDGAPAFPDKSQFLHVPPHLAASSTYSPHSSVTDNCRHGDFRRNIFFRLYETTCKRCKMMFDNVQFNILQKVVSPSKLKQLSTKPSPTADLVKLRSLKLSI